MPAAAWGRVSGKRHLQHEHCKERTDRVDEYSLGFEHGLQPRAEAQIPHKGTNDSRACNDDERAEKRRERPRPEQPQTRRNRGAHERDHRPSGDEATDDTFLAPESSQIEVERALEQDHGDGEIDQEEQAVTERRGPHPSKTFRSQCRAGREQENDRRYAYQPGDALDRHAGHQRDGHDEGGIGVCHSSSRHLS